MSNLYDYQAFANGRMVEVLAGNREREVWARQAGALSGELKQTQLNALSWEVQTQAWLEVAKILREAIQDLDPNSPLAKKEYLNDLYRGFVNEFAQEQGCFLDDDGKLRPKS
jgi:hypothetical protein